MLFNLVSSLPTTHSKPDASRSIPSKPGLKCGHRKSKYGPSCLASHRDERRAQLSSKVAQLLKRERLVEDGHRERRRGMSCTMASSWDRRNAYRTVTASTSSLHNPKHQHVVYLQQFRDSPWGDYRLLVWLVHPRRYFGQQFVSSNSSGTGES